MISKIFSSIQNRIRTKIYPSKNQQKKVEQPQNKTQQTMYQPIENNSQLILGKDFVLDLNNPELKEKLAKKKEVKVGSSERCNIVVPSFHNGIHQTHISIKQKNNQTMITPAHKDAKVKVIDKDNIQPFYFGTKDIAFAQENIGDCYLLSTLYSLSRTSFGQNFLKNIVSINNDGNYVVKFFKKPPIIVKKDELYGNENKKSVSGELGLKAIERAYGKLINPLYMNPKEREIAASKNHFYLNRGGFMTTALYNLTGLKTNQYKTKETDLDFLLKNIKEYGMEHQILTCSTPAQGFYGTYMDKESKFMTAHAYSIKEIDVENKMIEIVNPHNTKKSEIISWEDFKKMFEYICVARLKKDTQN